MLNRKDITQVEPLISTLYYHKISKMYFLIAVVCSYQKWHYEWFFGDITEKFWRDKYKISSKADIASRILCLRPSKNETKMSFSIKASYNS